jgi:hypothetical protein
MLVTEVLFRSVAWPFVRDCHIVVRAQVLTAGNMITVSGGIIPYNDCR